MKSKWNQAIDKFIATTGETPTKRHFFKLFNDTWGEALTAHNLVAGFRATGIWPLDNNVIKDDIFGPSQLYTGDLNTAVGITKYEI